MKKIILKFLLSFFKIEQAELIEIHDETVYGKSYMEYIKQYRKYVYDNGPKPDSQISTDWHDSPSLTKLRIVKTTFDLINN